MMIKHYLTNRTLSLSLSLNLSTCLPSQLSFTPLYLLWFHRLSLPPWSSYLTCLVHFSPVDIFPLSFTPLCFFLSGGTFVSNLAPPSVPPPPSSLPSDYSFTLLSLFLYCIKHHLRRAALKQNLYCPTCLTPPTSSLPPPFSSVCREKKNEKMYYPSIFWLLHLHHFLFFTSSWNL